MSVELVYNLLMGCAGFKCVACSENDPNLPAGRDVARWA